MGLGGNSFRSRNIFFHHCSESFAGGFDFSAGVLDLEALVVLLVDGFAPASFKSKSKLIYWYKFLITI